MKNTLRLRSCPSTSVNRITRSPTCSTVGPTTRPPTKAAMKPLPPIWSASAQAMIASARRARRWNEAVIHPLCEAHLTSQPPTSPTPTPTRIPKPTCSSAKRIQRSADKCSSSASARVKKSARKGTERPSLSPASTFKAWRMRAGTRGLLTTAWPSAASVGARTVPTMAASQKVRSVSTSAAKIIPSTMVSGIPIPRRRRGNASFCRRAERFVLAASVNSTIARAISPTKSTVWSSSLNSTRPSPQGPSTKPAATNTIGAVRIVPSSRRETRPNAKTTLARTTKSTIAGSRKARKQSDAAGHQRNCLTHEEREDRFGKRVNRTPYFVPRKYLLAIPPPLEAVSNILYLAGFSCCTSPYSLRRCFAALFEGKVHFLVALLHMASQRASEQRDEQAPKHFPLDEKNAVSF